MLDFIQDFFRRRVLDPAAGSVPEDRERALRIAAAALLFEVVRADAEVKEEERTVMRAALQGSFDLTATEVSELMQLGEEASRRAISLFEFTSELDGGFSPEHKKRIVELLWLVAFADGEKSAVEEHLVRRIAGLLHVSHPDFIDAKIRARASTNRDRS